MKSLKKLLLGIVIIIFGGAIANVDALQFIGAGIAIVGMIIFAVTYYLWEPSDK